jgi:hypothetical protein
MRKTPMRVAIVIATLAAAGTAGAHGLTLAVSLRIVGVHPTTRATCAHDSDLYADVAKGTTVHLAGRVTPNQNQGKRVTIQVQQCIGGRFKLVWTQKAGGAADGRYTLAYPATTPGLFKAKAIYGKRHVVNSGNRHFRVR